MPDPPKTQTNTRKATDTIRDLLSEVATDLENMRSLVAAARKAVASAGLDVTPPAVRAVLEEESRLNAWADRLRDLEQRIAQDAEVHRSSLHQAEEAIRLRAADLAAREVSINELALKMSEESQRINRERASNAVARARIHRQLRELDEERAKLDRFAAELSDLERELDQRESELERRRFDREDRAGRAESAPFPSWFVPKRRRSPLFPDDPPMSRS
jgi:chromosome segregation ATPase